MAERVMMKGNEALAEAAIQAGCKHFFGYPITPQTEINAYMSKKLPTIGGTYLQAESEVAAINMVLGAASAGIRCMTSSSSPGVSLKSEGISYIAASDLPCLIVNIQRGGPGLGGIQPSQSDYNQATHASGHGDFHLLVFAPASVQEVVDMVFLAFELGEKYRMPSMILGDGLLGQMMEPLVFPHLEPKRYEKPWATTGHGESRPKNIVNSLYLQADILEQKNLERYQRYAEVEKNEPRSEGYLLDDADVVVTAFGASARVARTAVDRARAKGIKAGLLRPITLWPFPKDAYAAVADRGVPILSVEMNMGQMVNDVKLAVEHRVPVHFYGRVGGMIPTPDAVLAEIEAIVGGVKA